MGAVICTLFSAVLLRTSVTLLDVDHITNVGSVTFNDVFTIPPVGIQTRLTHICSVTIWIALTIVTVFLGVQMNSLGGDTSVRKNLTLLSMLGYIFCILCTVAYEVWMFAYIFTTYAISCAFGIQLVLFVPFWALICHSIHQMVFLMHLKGCPRRYSERFLVHIYLSGFFNLIMLIHLFCMAVTAIYRFGGIFDLSTEKYVIIPLGFVELLYRCYAVRRYYLLWTIHKNQPVSVISQYTGESNIEQESHGNTYTQNNEPDMIVPRTNLKDYVTADTTSNTHLVNDNRPTSSITTEESKSILEYAVLPEQCSNLFPTVITIAGKRPKINVLIIRSLN